MNNLTLEKCKARLSNPNTPNKEILEALQYLETCNNPVVVDILLKYLERELPNIQGSQEVEVAKSILVLKYSNSDDLGSEEKNILLSYCKTNTLNLQDIVLELLDGYWDKDDLSFLESLEFPENPIAQKLHLKALAELHSSKLKAFVRKYGLS